MKKPENKNMRSIRIPLTWIRSVYKRNWRFSFVLLYTIMSVYVLLELKNHRFHMSDFHVYYVAASRIIQGGKSVPPHRGRVLPFQVLSDFGVIFCSFFIPALFGGADRLLVFPFFHGMPRAVFVTAHACSTI
jgi:hypothetical protein